jgi:hypothetical protein
LIFKRSIYDFKISYSFSVKAKTEANPNLPRSVGFVQVVEDDKASTLKMVTLLSNKDASSYEKSQVIVKQTPNGKWLQESIDSKGVTNSGDVDVKLEKGKIAEISISRIDDAGRATNINLMDLNMSKPKSKIQILGADKNVLVDLTGVYFQSTKSSFERALKKVTATASDSKN